MKDKCNNDEKHIDRCPCSTGDYTELFSNTKSEKRTDLRMGIIYFIALILSTYNRNLAYLTSFIAFISVIYYIIKKDRNMVLRCLAIPLFCLVTFIF